MTKKKKKKKSEELSSQIVLPFVSESPVKQPKEHLVEEGIFSFLLCQNLFDGGTASASGGQGCWEGEMSRTSL